VAAGNRRLEEISLDNLDAAPKRITGQPLATSNIFAGVTSVIGFLL